MNQKELLLISITIFLTIIAWIVADLNHQANIKRIKVDNESVARVLDVRVDQQIFTILKQKK